MDRRNFLQTSIAAIAGVIALPLLARASRTKVKTVPPRNEISVWPGVVYCMPDGIWYETWPLAEGHDPSPLYDLSNAPRESQIYRMYEAPTGRYPEGREVEFMADGTILHSRGSELFPTKEE